MVEVNLDGGESDSLITYTAEIEIAKYFYIDTALSL